MKKSFLLFLIVSGITLQFSSCKKDDDTVIPITTTYSIEGLWRGTYSVDGSPQLGQQELNLTIKPDGTMVNDSKAGPQQHIALGAWTLTGDTAFVCTATCVYGYPNSIGDMQKHTATFSKTTGQLTLCTWINLPAGTGSGTFTLTKVD